MGLMRPMGLIAARGTVLFPLHLAYSSKLFISTPIMAEGRKKFGFQEPKKLRFLKFFSKDF
jgi:hypothetical protein